MKKICLIILAAVVTTAVAMVLLTYCDNSETIYVGISMHRLDDTAMSVYRMEMEAYFETLETDITKYNLIVKNANNSAEEQMQQVDEFIEQKVDVMIINLVRPASAGTITQKAKSADIPVVYISRMPDQADMNAWDKVVYVGADIQHSGVARGNIVSGLPNRGDADGDGVVRYAVISIDPEDADTQMRTQFSVKTMADAGIELEELFVKESYREQALWYELTSELLARYGNQIEVIFCDNDEIITGILQAVADAGRITGGNIFIIGANATPESISAVNNGAMTSTVLNDQTTQAHTAADTAVKLIQGEPVGKYILIEYIAIG